MSSSRRSALGSTGGEVEVPSEAPLSSSPSSSTSSSTSSSSSSSSSTIGGEVEAPLSSSSSSSSLSLFIITRIAPIRKRIDKLVVILYAIASSGFFVAAGLRLNAEIHITDGTSRVFLLNAGNYLRVPSAVILLVAATFQFLADFSSPKYPIDYPASLLQLFAAVSYTCGSSCVVAARYNATAAVSGGVFWLVGGVFATLSTFVLLSAEVMRSKVLAEMIMVEQAEHHHHHPTQQQQQLPSSSTSPTSSLEHRSVRAPTVTGRRRRRRRNRELSFASVFFWGTLCTTPIFLSMLFFCASILFTAASALYLAQGAHAIKNAEAILLSGSTLYLIGLIVDTAIGYTKLVHTRRDAVHVPEDLPPLGALES